MEKSHNGNTSIITGLDGIKAVSPMKDCEFEISYVPLFPTKPNF